MSTFEIHMPSGDRVEARFDGLVVATDQDGSEPAPFELFLASIGTCAGIYVSRFCQRRGIDPSRVRIVQRNVAGPENGMVARIEIDVLLPDDFPQHYREPVVRSALKCAVKRHLEQPPEIEVRATIGASV